MNWQDQWHNFSKGGYPICDVKTVDCDDGKLLSVVFWLVDQTTGFQEHAVYLCEPGGKCRYERQGNFDLVRATPPAEPAGNEDEMLPLPELPRGSSMVAEVTSHRIADAGPIDDATPDVESVLSDVVCEQLPEDWRIDIRLEHGTIDVLLFDPNGEHVDEPFEGEAPEVNLMVLRRVNYARKKDGLQPYQPERTARRGE